MKKADPKKKNSRNSFLEILNHKLFHTRWMKAVSVLASIVVFVTVYMLILPAATITPENASQEGGFYLTENQTEGDAAPAMNPDSSGGAQAKEEACPDGSASASGGVEDPADSKTGEAVSNTANAGGADYSDTALNSSATENTDTSSAGAGEDNTIVSSDNGGDTSGESDNTSEPAGEYQESSKPEAATVGAETSGGGTDIGAAGESSTETGSTDAGTTASTGDDNSGATASNAEAASVETGSSDSGVSPAADSGGGSVTTGSTSQGAAEAANAAGGSISSGPQENGQAKAELKEAEPKETEPKETEQGPGAISYTDKPLEWHDGKTDILVSFDKEAKIPEGSVLEVTALEAGTEEHRAYYRRALTASLQEKAVYTEEQIEKKVTRAMKKYDAAMTNGTAPQDEARIFDIVIRDAAGEKVEPAREVSVDIRFPETLTVKNDAEMKLVHFADEKKEENEPAAEENSTGSSESDQSGSGSSSAANDNPVAMLFKKAAKLLGIGQSAEVTAAGAETATTAADEDSSSSESALSGKHGTPVATPSNMKETGTSTASTILAEVDLSVEADPEYIEKAEIIAATELSEGTTGADTAAADMKDVEGINFTAESFSIYALIYTVDFEYEVDGQVYAYSMEGGSSISLKTLLPLLGAITQDQAEDFVVNEIESVTFSNLELVEVVHQTSESDVESADWILNSLQPFNTEETLTINTWDGQELQIRVTDAQEPSLNMRDAVQSATLNGQSGSDWTVKEGEEYTIHMVFEETPGVVQFPTTSNTLTYQFPPNFQPHGNLENAPLTLTYTEESIVHTLTGCTFSVNSDGTLTINLTDFAKEKLASSGDGKINLDINGFFTQSNEHTDFGGGNIKNIILDSTHDVTVNKTGEYNSTDNKVHYKVTVKADGSLTNVKVSDVISGTALTMDQGSLKISGNSSTPSGGATSTGIDMTFPSMKNGETITIEYTASVNWNVIGDGKGTAEQTGNTVKVKPDETEEKEKPTNLENKITYNPLMKSSGDVQNTSDPDTKIVPWTITVNGQGLKNMKNTTITDHNNSPAVMHYAGDGIKIEKFQVNADGTTTSQGSVTKTWDELGIDPESDTSWAYQITDDGNYKYVITYTTEVDVTGRNGNTTVSNWVSDQDNNNYGSGSNVGPGTAKIGVDKEFGTATKEKMTWTVRMDVPATGLSKAIMKDTLPSSGRYRDTLDADSIQVTGLENGDSYVLSQTARDFTLTFYKDSEHSESGLNATGKPRQIIVTFSTINDPEWVANDRNAEHENRVSYQGDNSTVYDSDKGKISPSGVEKNAYGYKKITVDGVEKLAFEYTIDLYGVTEDDLTNGLTVTDDYDERYLEFLDVSGKTITGIDPYWVQQFQNGYNGGTHFDTKFVPSDSNGILTFYIQSSDLPRNGEVLYPQYQIRYYLVAKDSSQLLQASLEEKDRILTLTNKAKWGTSEDEATVDYGYPGVVKTNVAPSSLQGQNVTYNPETQTTGFKIVINPDKLELNGGEPMTLEDVFSDNLSVDYSSIKVTVEPASDLTGEQLVTYDYKGNTGIYIIPDKCKVTITYDARVIGKPNEWVTYGNTATMHGFTDSASGRAQIGGSGDGGFNIFSIKLFKYSAGHMEQPLQGATFTLVDEHNNPVVYPDHATNGKAGQPITFTTEQDGYINVLLREQEDGISLQQGITYYLKETISPATHAINNTTYRFTLSDQPNYSNYEYHSGDIMKVYDWPIQGRIVLEKEIEGPTNLTKEDQEKITFVITGTYDDGTPIKVDSWGYAIEKINLPKYTAEQLAEMEDFRVKISYADFTDGKYVMADLVDGIYSVKETAAALPGFNSVATVSKTYEVNTDGSRVDENETQAQNDVTVTITDHSKYVVNYKNTYSNRKSPAYDLIIKKVDSENQAKTLYGATFRLEKKNAGGNYQAVTAEQNSSTDQNGLFSIPYANKDTGVTLQALEPGDYRITEVQAPANYKMTGDGIIEFKVAEDGTVTTTKGSNISEYVPDNASKTVSGTYTIKNEVKHSYIVTKADGANISLKLPGAVFGVWESSYPSTADVTTAMNADRETATEPLWTYTTKANGQFEILKEDHPYEEGKIYFFKEITAPAGYEVPQNPSVNYFFFSYNGTPPTAMKPVNLGIMSRSQTITNDLPDLKVTKLWKNLKGDNLNKQDIDVDYIDFKVYQKATVKTPNGTVVSEGAETRFPNDKTTYTIEYSNGQWSTVSIPNAPAMGKTSDGNFIYYTYRVEEVVPERWVANVAYSSSGREATITNTPEPMNIKVKKVWNAPQSMAEKDPGNDYVTVRIEQLQDDGTWKTFVVNNTEDHKLNHANHFEMTFEVEAGHTYRVREMSYQFGTKTSGFTLSYEVEVNGVKTQSDTISEAGTVIMTNTYDEPYLEIVKDWQTETNHSDYEIWLNIFRRNITQNGDWELWYGEGKEQDKAKLDYRQDWKLAFIGDALQTNGDEYEYYVEEYLIKASSTNWNNVVNNFYVTYSASRSDPLKKEGTITVTNSDKYEGKVTVEKQWQDQYGNTLDSAKVPNEVKVILQRAEAEEIGKTVVLSIHLTNGKTESKRVTLPEDKQTVSFEFLGNLTYDCTWSGIGENVSIEAKEYNVPPDNKTRYRVTVDNITEDCTINLNQSGGNDWNTIGEISVSEEITVSRNPVTPFEDVAGTEQTLVKPNWSYTWENLRTDAGDGKVYVYKVREISVDGKAPAKAGFISTVTPENGTTKGTVTVTNKEIQKGSLKITKQVTVGGNPTTTQKADGTYTFKIKDAEEKTVKTVQITIENGAAQTLEVEDLAEGTYTVTETASTNPDVTIDPEPKTVVVTGGKTGNEVPENGIVTITNNAVVENVALNILKVDKNNESTKLAGAKFKIWKLDSGNATVTHIGADPLANAETNVDGQAQFANLESGYYEITETDPPAGYILTGESSFYIQVDGKTISLLNKADGKAPNEWTTAQTSGNVKTFTANTSAGAADATVENEPGSELPMTGGPGTRIFTILGALLVAFAGVMLLRRRRT